MICMVLGMELKSLLMCLLIFLVYQVVVAVSIGCPVVIENKKQKGNAGIKLVFFIYCYLLCTRFEGKVCLKLYIM